MRPLLLDLFCGGGGAGAGYHQAGFDVVGVDLNPQRHYPFPMVVWDALDLMEYLLTGKQFLLTGRFCGERWVGLKDLAAIACSPPCQGFSALRHLPHQKEHPDLITPLRPLLQATGLPYVMENVVGAPLENPILLCGTMFGLQTEDGAELRRHRLFETNWFCMVGMTCNHYTADRKGDSRRGTVTVIGHSGGSSSRDRKTIVISGTGQPMTGARDKVISVHGDHARLGEVAHVRKARQTVTVTGSTPQQNTERNVIRECFTVAQAREAMGISWLPMTGLSQAIPPAMTHWIGLQLLALVKGDLLCP